MNGEPLSWTLRVGGYAPIAGSLGVQPVQELQYLIGKRYYDQDIGRWTAVDPSRQFFDRYAYAGNGKNPICAIDKDGGRLVFAAGTSTTYQAEFARAVQYLNRNNTAGTIARLEARPEVITIREGSGLANDWFDANTNEISWSATSAMQTLDNAGTITGSVSPAVIFLHEASHALQAVSNPTQFDADSRTPVVNYDDAEEQRVIAGSESRAATRTGETARTNHQGNEIIVNHSDERQSP